MYLLSLLNIQVFTYIRKTIVPKVLYLLLLSQSNLIFSYLCLDKTQHTPDNIALITIRVSNNIKYYKNYN